MQCYATFLERGYERVQLILGPAGAFHLVNYPCTRTHTLAPDSVCNFRVSAAQNHVASVESCMTATVTAENEAGATRIGEIYVT